MGEGRVKQNGVRVLVVDDDADSREAIAQVLEQQGYTAARAENGKAALDHLEAGFDADLVLTDLLMPVMSGWELHAAMKARLAWASIPFVVLAGMTPEQRGQLNVEDSFEKPTDLPVLLKRIAELCGLSG
ncbi:MAG: response regulator [Myxococcota bacterium]